jgi:hypothetical protein
MVFVGRVLIENVFAMTLTGLPDVPNWRAGADTLEVDCMVYVSTGMSGGYKEKGKIQNAGVQGGQIGNGLGRT